MPSAEVVIPVAEVVWLTISCPWTLTKGRAQVGGREVMPSEYERMVGDAVLLDGR